MRLGSLTLSVVLLSGCSFIGGQQGQTNNPYANQQAGQYGQIAPSQHCQIATPRQPIPRGCRPAQVTIGVPQQRQANGGNGFPQQPQFGQPQYTSGGYGAAVGASPAVAHHTGPKKRKPRLRGSLSLGVERSFSGDLIDPRVRTDLNPTAGYNPQDFNEGRVEGSQADGLVTSTIYTANDFGAANIFAPNGFERSSAPEISFDDAWSTPAQIKAGVEYIVNDKTTIFANGGYTYSEGNEGDVASVDATLYEFVQQQAFTPALDAAGTAIPGAFVPDGAPLTNTSFNPNQRIATFAYDFSDLNQYDLEVGARRYFNPIGSSEGYKTVTPFVGASVGVSYVNAVDISVSQRQAFFEQSFNGDPATFSVPTGANSTRLYDSDWLPQGQINVGAEWQLTPGFALAAETGLKIQGSREYADFVNAAGETVSGRNGDSNITVPLTLRGSINF